MNQQNKGKTVFKFDPPHNAEAVAIYRELMSIMERSCTSVGFQSLGELAPFFLGRFDEFIILCVRLDEDKAYVLKALQFKLGLTRACQQAGATTDLLRSMFLGATQNDEASDYTRSMIAASAKRKSSDSFGFDDEQQQPPQQQRRRASISSSPGAVGSGSPSPFQQQQAFMPAATPGERCYRCGAEGHKRSSCPAKAAGLPPVSRDASGNAFRRPS